MYWRYFIIGSIVALGIAVFGLPKTSDLFFVAQHVQCYPATPTKGRTIPTFRDVLAKLGAKPPTVDDTARINRKAIESSVGLLRDAAKSCIPTSCPTASLLTLRDAFYGYLRHRSGITTDLLRHYGDEGRAMALTAFGSMPQRALATDLRALFDAGILDLSLLGQQRAAAALFILRPIEAFRPCGSS